MRWNSQPGSQLASKPARQPWSLESILNCGPSFKNEMGRNFPPYGAEPPQGNCGGDVAAAPPPRGSEFPWILYEISNAESPGVLHSPLINKLRERFPLGPQTSLVLLNRTKTRTRKTRTRKIDGTDRRLPCL